MENQTKKILLLSNEPADVSFLSEIAVTQLADLELVQDLSELWSKIIQFRSDHSLAAVFVDITKPVFLRKFEFELQTKLGNSVASEIRNLIHFISGTSLTLNREVLQSPYFSFYLERQNFNFHEFATFYRFSFYQAKEYSSMNALSFDQASKVESFERLKKEFLQKNISTEWIMKFKKVWDELFEVHFPSRFEMSVNFKDNTFIVLIGSKSNIQNDQLRLEKLLELGVSATISGREIVLFIPVFEKYLDLMNALKFLKVERS